MGVAFDGDGDRAIFVDHRGRIVDGDHVLLMCGRQLQAEGRLKGNAIVATVMSNIGLEIALRDLGIALVRCAVGDKYVMEEMLARDLSLGGEQSGHVIFSEYLFTGDGLCTALNVLRTIAVTGRSLADLAGDLVSYPQVLLNVRVREKVDLARRAGGRGGHRARRIARGGPGPAARPVFGHRAAAARDARRAARGRNPGLGPGDHRHGEGTSRVNHQIAKSPSHQITKFHDSPECQRQQGRDAAQLARRPGAASPRRGGCVSGRGRRRHHRASARRSPSHHARGRPRDRRRAGNRGVRRSNTTSRAIPGRICSRWCSRSGRISARSSRLHRGRSRVRRAGARVRRPRVCRP